MDSKFAEIGEFFKQSRQTAGVSQAKLSKILGFKSPQIISNWERGLCSPPLNCIAKMIEVFNLEAFEVIDFMTQANRKYLTRQLLNQPHQQAKTAVK